MNSTCSWGLLGHEELLGDDIRAVIEETLQRRSVVAGENTLAEWLSGGHIGHLTTTRQVFLYPLEEVFSFPGGHRRVHECVVLPRVGLAVDLVGDGEPEAVGIDLGGACASSALLRSSMKSETSIWAVTVGSAKPLVLDSSSHSAKGLSTPSASAASCNFMKRGRRGRE